MTVTRRR